MRRAKVPAEEVYRKVWEFLEKAPQERKEESTSMDEVVILKPGDPCPCCGKPIVTKSRRDLVLLTILKEQLEVRAEGGAANVRAFQERMIALQDMLNDLSH